MAMNEIERQELFAMLQKGFDVIPSKGKIEEEQAITALGLIAHAMCETLLSHTEESLQVQSNNIQYFIHRSDFVKYEPSEHSDKSDRVNVAFRRKDNPNKEITVLAVHHSAHRLVIDEKEVDPSGWTPPRQRILIDTSERSRWQTCRKNAVKTVNNEFYLFWNGEIIRHTDSAQDAEFVTVWNAQYARRFFKELKRLTREIQPMIFDK